MIDRQTAHRC